MPGPNTVILASGAAVAVTVAVAAAIAIYESPELRRYADDLRRRIAIAVNGVGDNISQRQSREPVFNRPEDAEGFMLSGHGQGTDHAVEADEETRRRQREELMYWNSLKLEKQRDGVSNEKTLEKVEERPVLTQRGSTFDDFMTKDDAEKGAFVYNSGSAPRPSANGLRHRGEVNRGIAASLLANPFADEFGIGNDDLAEVQKSEVAMAREEILSDIYSATTRDGGEKGAEAERQAVPDLIDVGDEPARTESSATLERDLAEDEYVTAGQDSSDEAYASIQAWAQNAAENQSGAPTPNFYSPLPVTPVAPISEPEMVSDGQLTPTDSASLIGSGEDIGDEVRSRAGEASGKEYDVLSESEGMLTPASWSEVGSVVSEYEAPMPARP